MIDKANKTSSEDLVKDIAKSSSLSSSFDLTTQIISVDTIVSLLENKTIDLDIILSVRPIYWSIETQSLFIESLLLRMPVQPFYIDVTDNEKWTVIDGFERLFTIKKFIIDNELVITREDYSPEINHRRYKDLPKSLKRMLKSCTITIHQYDFNRSPGIKYSLIERLNKRKPDIPMIQQLLTSFSIYSIRALEHISSFEVTKKLFGEGINTLESYYRMILFFHTSESMIVVDRIVDDRAHIVLSLAIGIMNIRAKYKPIKLYIFFKRAFARAYFILGKDPFNRSIYDGPRFSYGLYVSWLITLSALSIDDCKSIYKNKDDFRESLKTLYTSKLQDGELCDNIVNYTIIVKRNKIIQSFIRDYINDRIC